MKAFLPVLALACLSATVLSADLQPITPGKPVPPPNSHVGFDFIEVDSQAPRLLAPHTKNGTFDVFNLPDGTLVKQCAVGAVQDAAVDSSHGK